MVSKVFLFDGVWLYCSDVKMKDNVYSAWVNNGAWHLFYYTETNIGECFRDESEKRAAWSPVTTWTRKLTWACYPEKSSFDYNSVIEEAKERYKAGEEANYSLEPIKKIEEDYDDDEVPF